MHEFIFSNHFLITTGVDSRLQAPMVVGMAVTCAHRNPQMPSVTMIDRKEGMPSLASRQHVQMCSLGSQLRVSGFELAIFDDRMNAFLFS